MNLIVAHLAQPAHIKRLLVIFVMRFYTSSRVAILTRGWPYHSLDLQCVANRSSGSILFRKFGASLFLQSSSLRVVLALAFHPIREYFFPVFFSPNVVRGGAFCTVPSPVYFAALQETRFAERVESVFPATISVETVKRLYFKASRAFFHLLDCTTERLRVLAGTPGAAGACAAAEGVAEVRAGLK